jgi:hypothetical protein
MNSRFAIFLLVAVVLGEILLLIYSQEKKGEKRRREYAESHKLGEPMPKWEAAAAAAKQKLPTMELDVQDPGDDAPPQPEPKNLPPIQNAHRALRGTAPKGDVLAAMERALLAQPPESAIRQILAFLRSGEDFPTGMRLLPDQDRLSPASSLRVALLDLLGRLCRKTGTREAADVGREVLHSPDSADEFAVCLRNVAWIEPDSSGYLADRLDVLLSNQAWSENPSGGFEAALDVAAFLGDAKRLAPLEELAKNPALRIPAEAAMERLCEYSPMDCFRILNRKPALLESLPKTRAILFAKADFFHSEQRAAAETYLDRADVGPLEKTTLIEELWRQPGPRPPALLTRPRETAEKDVRARRISGLVQEWLESGRFKPLKPNLEALQRRLGTPTGPIRETDQR